MAQDRNQIVELETRFWQSMVDKDVPTAKAMIAEECIVTGPMGTMRVGPEKFGEMTKDGSWQLNRFDLTKTDVTFPAEGVAVIAYEVHQQGTMKGDKMDLRCADATTWVRDGSDWKIALHTETILKPALADA